MFAGNKGKIFFIFAALSYGILSIFYTYPLIRYFSIAVPGPGGDASQFIWALWHLKNNILSSDSKFDIAYLDSFKMPICSAFDIYW